MNKTTITITIENAESVRDNLADLLCWWQGFKAGLSLNKDAFSNTPVDFADNGIEAARNLSVKIKDQISAHYKNSQSTI